MGKIVYHVEQWESEQSSVSTIHRSLAAATRVERRALKNPGFGTRRVKVWKCELVSSKPTSRLLRNAAYADALIRGK